MSIASKNLYELLGNDPELDPDREPEPPTKAIDKPAPRTGKRNAPAEAPTRSGADSLRSGHRDTRNANDNAFRDRGVGSDKNRVRGTGDNADYPPRDRAPREGGRGGRGRGRGGGRGSGGFLAGDRHSRTGVAEHEKQAAHGWGGETGEAELADEVAGEAIAKQDEKEAVVDAPEGGEPAAEPEPEDKSVSYAAYLAELAEKKLSLAAQNVRKANEGSSKKFPEGKAITRDDDEEAYIAGSGGKAKRERERKQKEFVELDDAKLHRETRDSFRGGRGRGRGEFRGGEGRGRGGEGRGRGGRGRGDRGDRGDGVRGGGRGGRGGQSGPNITDSSAFPSLGS